MLTRQIAFDTISSNQSSFKPHTRRLEMNPNNQICQCCGEPSQGSLCAFCSLQTAQHEQQEVIGAMSFNDPMIQGGTI